MTVDQKPAPKRPYVDPNPDAPLDTSLPPALRLRESDVARIVGGMPTHPDEGGLMDLSVMGVVRYPDEDTTLPMTLR